MSETGITKKKIIKSIIYGLVVILFVLCAYEALGKLDYLNISPFTDSYTWDIPSYCSGDGEYSAVIDSSKSKIFILNKDMQINGVIYGNGSDSCFSSCDYVTVSGENVYVADVRYASSGTRVKSEYIKKFDLSGNYICDVFEVEYDDGKDTMPAQNGYVCWMGEYAGEVYFIYFTPLELTVNKITDSETVTLRTISAELVPDMWNIAYSVTEDKVWLVGKDSVIYSENEKNDGFSKFDNGSLYSELSIYDDIDIYGDKIYATDIGRRCVTAVNNGTVFIGGNDVNEDPIIYRLSANKDGIMTTDNESIIAADPENGVTYYESSALYTENNRLNVKMVWISVIYIGLVVLAVLAAISLYTLKNSRSKYARTSVLIAGVVIISTAIIAVTILGETFTRLSGSTINGLQRTAQVISQSSSENGLGDAVKSIDSTDDYGNENHTFISNYLDKFCDASYDTGSNMYYVVYKYNDYMVYGIADYEKTTGAIYPYCPYDESVYKDVVETGETFTVANSSDAYGSWSFTDAPIYDSEGNITAVIELGINMKTESSQNSDLIMSIIVKIAVVIVLTILLLVEGTVFSDGVSKFRTEHDLSKPYFLRPLVFLTFFASNLSAAFIPQLSLDLFGKSSLPLSSTFASALPMSLQLFFIAFSAFCCGRVLEKINMKTVMLSSCVIQVIGYIIIAVGYFMESYELFTVGHAVSGFGIGFCIVSFNTLPDGVNDEDERNNYYSNLNAGVISGVVVGCAVGSYISDTVGYGITFIVSAAVVLCIALLVFISISRKQYTVVKEESEAKKISGFKFFTNRRVFMFVVCVMVPFLIMLYFKDYLFPLYGWEQGMNDVTIGNILLFAGAISIIFSTSVTEWLIKKFGNIGIITISSVLTCGCLLMFGLYPGREMATVIVFILSFVTGFGLSGQELYFTSLPAFKEYGAKRSMSVYSICDNVSQTAGPLLMGALLFMNFSGACFTIGAACLALFIVFRLLVFTEDKLKGNKEKLSGKEAE